MPVMSLKIDRRYNGQQCISEYHYVASGVPAAVSLSFALAAAWGVIDTAGLYDAAKPFGTLRGIQNDQVQYRECVVKDLYSVTDFYTTPFLANTVGVSGGGAGSMAPFIACEFRTNRIRADIRRGFKRYEGLDESASDPFGTISAAFLALMHTHALAISSTLTYTDEGNSLTFTPCVISLKKNTTDPDQGTYIKWPTEAEQLAHLASGVVYNEQLVSTTQNSRKQGRGS